MSRRKVKADNPATYRSGAQAPTNLRWEECSELSGNQFIRGKVYFKQHQVTSLNSEESLSEYNKKNTNKTKYLNARLSLREKRCQYGVGDYKMQSVEKKREDRNMISTILYR